MYHDHFSLCVNTTNIENLSWSIFEGFESCLLDLFMKIISSLEVHFLLSLDPSLSLSVRLLLEWLQQKVLVFQFFRVYFIRRVASCLITDILLFLVDFIRVSSLVLYHFSSTPTIFFTLFNLLKFRAALLGFFYHFTIFRNRRRFLLFSLKLLLLVLLFKLSSVFFKYFDLVFKLSDSIINWTIVKNFRLRNGKIIQLTPNFFD